MRKVLRGALASTRCAATPREEFETAGELLRALNAGVAPGSLILLDWNLPGLDVLTLLSHLDGTGMLPQLSILLCANRADRLPAEEAVRRGARGVLLRPFSNEDLAAKIDELVPAISAPAPAAPVSRDLPATLRGQENLPSLLSLPSGLLAQLFERATRTRHEPGSAILRPGDPVDALAFVTSGEVELDPGTVRGAGECFGEHAFICGEPATVGARALSSVEVASVPKEAMVDLARRHPALQDFLTLLLTRREPPADAGGAEIAGTVASLSFYDLLQYLHSTRRSGTLVLEQEGERGRISFERGDVSDARAGGESGEEAFRRIAGWKRASFEFRSGAAPAARTVFQSTMKLLFSAWSPEPAVEADWRSQAG